MKLTTSNLHQLIQEELAEQEKKKVLLREGLSAIFSKLLAGDVEHVKENIAKKIMEFLGIDTGSILAEVFINFFGNLEVRDIIDILTGDNRCLTGTGELVAAITETIVEQLPQAVGLDVNGLFAGAMREALSKTLTEDFNEQLAIALCDIDYYQLLKELPGGEFLYRFLG